MQLLYICLCFFYHSYSQIYIRVKNFNIRVLFSYFFENFRLICVENCKYDWNAHGGQDIAAKLIELYNRRQKRPAADKSV